MYHELTYRQLRNRRGRRIAYAVIVVALAVVMACAANIAMVSAREQAVIAVRDSVLNAAKQCCAIEGSYPASLSHLEREYGLVVNHDDYLISYEWFADNVLPSVIVSVR